MPGYWARIITPSHVVAFASGVVTILLFGTATALLTDVRTALLAVVPFSVAVLVLACAAYWISRDRAGEPAPLPPLVDRAMVRHRDAQEFETTRAMRPPRSYVPARRRQ